MQMEFWQIKTLIILFWHGMAGFFFTPDRPHPRERVLEIWAHRFFQNYHRPGQNLKNVNIRGSNRAKGGLVWGPNRIRGIATVEAPTNRPKRGIVNAGRICKKKF